MLFKSIQWRLVCMFITVALTLAIPVGLVLNNRVEAIYYNRFLDGIESGFRNWQVNEDSDLNYMLLYLRDEMNSLYLFNLDEYKSYTIIERSDVNSVAHSSDALFNSNKSKLLAEIMQSQNLIAVLGGAVEGRSERIISADDRRYYDYARVVRLTDGEYVLYFRYNKEAWSSLTDSFSNAILLSIALSIVIASISGYLLAKTITNPIKRLMSGANAIAEGQLDQVLDVKSDDEIGKLTGAFNTMAKSLKENVEEITSEKSKQENILNNTKDSILAFNMKGDVILYNPVVPVDLGEEFTELPFDSFAERFSMNRTVAEILEKGEITNWEVTVEHGEKMFDIYCSVFSDISNKPGGIIAVVDDSTERHRLENMRREFVANVSHELRTPLTSIISYSETLLDGGIDDREISEKFLGVIHSEADRMARLVKELLQLSRFDNSQARWVFNPIDIVTILKTCVDQMQISATKKAQMLSFYIFGEVPNIWADKDKLEQVFINIIGNALKYTPEGGSVSVYISKMGAYVHVKVSDTGIGVPAEDIPRLCERFFRVDKARSREMGGTGLGLAIASEIIEGHQGSLKINSELGKGTDVIIVLPINAADTDAE